jgi:hypothetical protein
MSAKAKNDLNGLDDTPHTSACSKFEVRGCALNKEVSSF